MHIYEGVLTATTHGKEVLLAGAAVAAAGTAIGLRKLDYERVPRVAVLSAAFFVASLIHVPVGPTSFHLTLSGLMGLVLGWAVFPALLIALLLQAVFVSFGGLTTLGLNTVLMALPGVACYYLFRPLVQRGNETTVATAGFAAGAIAILLGALLNAASLWAAGGEFQLFGHTVLALHLPVAAVEGLVTAQVVVLLKMVRPELLEAPLLSSSRVEVSHG